MVHSWDLLNFMTQFIQLKEQPHNLLSLYKILMKTILI
jgi:hypothetical protein